MSTVTAVPLQPTKRSYLIYLWLGIALALIGAVALARQGDDPLTRNGRAKGVVTTASGLQYKILTPGKPGAAKPTDADVALINYEGKLLDGTTFWILCWGCSQDIAAFATTLNNAGEPPSYPLTFKPASGFALLNHA